MYAAAAVYDEQDGDFHFTRGSKRVKTSAEPEAAAGPAKKAAGKTRQSSGRRRASSPIEEEPPAQLTSSKRPTRRNSNQPASVQSNDLVIPKARATRRKAPEALDKVEEVEPRPTSRSKAGAPKRHDDVAPVGTPMDGLKSGSSTEDNSAESRQIALPFSDTPIINRNKELRKKGGQRRSSLGMRGRRASSLIENGHSAIPHREVDPAEFYKHIEAEGLSEPRRMKQLLTWCGERAQSEKPPHGSANASAIHGGMFIGEECVKMQDANARTAIAIQSQLLKDFANRSEFSDWFSRPDEPESKAPKKPVVLKPNPRNIEHEEKIIELEAKIKRYANTSCLP